MPKKDITKVLDITLINRVKYHSDSEAFIEICRRCEKVFYRVCHSYSQVLYNNNVFLKDIMDEKNSLILGCIKSYNPHKNMKFSTYIGNYARFFCLNSRTANKMVIPHDNEKIMEYMENNYIKESYNKNNDHLPLIKTVVNNINDKRIVDIFNLRYYGDKKMSYGEIAKKINLSTQTVSILHRRGLNLLKNKIKNKDFYN